MNIINKISEFRIWLMTLAITFVVIYHYKCWVNGIPWYIGIILKYGYVGVDLFFFLSGFGLTYSYQRNDIKTFYVHRIKKILPSYILYGFIYILHIYFRTNESLTFSQILYKLCCLEYIFEHKGVDWFINAILILYILFPFIFHLIKGLKELVIISCIPIIYIITLHTDFYWTHLAMIHRIPMFLLGIYCGLNPNKDKNYINITLLYIIYFTAAIIHNKANMDFLYTTMITPLFVYIITISINNFHTQYTKEHSKCSLLEKRIQRIGSNTLEIFLGTNLAMLSYDYLPNTEYGIKAIIFIIALVFGSYLFHWITTNVNKFLLE